MTDPFIPPAERDEGDAERRRRRFKWGGIGAAGLLAVLLLVGLLLYARGHVILRRTYDAPGALTNVPTDAASIARGAHLARVLRCQQCHGDRLEGRVYLDIPPGEIVAPNLTRGRGGLGSAYSAADWDRAVRYGLRPDGRAILPFMPYDVYSRLNDADAAALASYLSALPAADNQVPATRLSFIGYIGFGWRGIDRRGLEAPRPIITPGATPEYGAYLASISCSECHGRRLQGGPPPARRAPRSPDLTEYGAHDVDILARAVRTGVSDDDRQLSDHMPWPYYSGMSDTEIAALHAYIATLPRD